MPSNNIRNFLIILIILFSSLYCSNENKIRKLQHMGNHQDNNKIDDNKPDDNRPDDNPNDPKKSDMDKEEDKLKNDYEEKMKENLLLKQQIEDKLKYIKILFVTGIIMLLIIIFILVKMCIGRKKNKIIPIAPKMSELKNFKKIDNSANSRIANSNYNLLNSDLSISNSISISSNNSYSNNRNINNSNLNENKGKSLNSANIEEFPEEKINDDNKTLTNNPDIFISSKTDKMLYQPYSKEEIYAGEKK